MLSRLTAFILTLCLLLSASLGLGGYSLLGQMKQQASHACCYQRSQAQELKRLDAAVEQAKLEAAAIFNHATKPTQLKRTARCCLSGSSDAAPSLALIGVEKKQNQAALTILASAVLPQPSSSLAFNRSTKQLALGSRAPPGTLGPAPYLRHCSFLI